MIGRLGRVVSEKEARRKLKDRLHEVKNHRCGIENLQGGMYAGLRSSQRSVIKD
jgi:hypothetical protein